MKKVFFAILIALLAFGSVWADPPVVEGATPTNGDSATQSGVPPLNPPAPGYPKATPGAPATYNSYNSYAITQVTKEELTLDGLNRLEALRVAGYKMPGSYPALISDVTSRGVIVGFRTEKGIEWRWGANITRAEFAQFSGRMLKVFDEAINELAGKHNRLADEFVAARNEFSRQLAVVNSRLDALEATVSGVVKVNKGQAAQITDLQEQKADQTALGWAGWWYWVIFLIALVVLGLFFLIRGIRFDGGTITFDEPVYTYGGTGFGSAMFSRY